MKMLKWSTVIVIFTISITCCSPTVPQQKFSAVTITILDSFGHPQSGCRILEFAFLGDEKNNDYASHFDGLEGRMIPYGSSYRVNVKCSDERSGGTFLVAVERPNAFLVLASWLNIGDYVTGPIPRLTVSLKSKRETELASGAWIKLVGLYLDRTEVDRIDVGSHTARFYEVVPGKYFMLLFVADRLVCTKRFDLVKAPADLELSVSGQSCNVEKESSVQVPQQE
jgi:hypothetical protein